MSMCIRNNPIYRSRDGVFLGVCRGLADHYGWSVFWLRLGLIIAFLLTGFWPVLGIYVVAALLLKPEPARPLENEAEEEFYESYVNSPRAAAQRVRRKYENLERRIRRMEDKVTGKAYDWERRFNS